MTSINNRQTVLDRLEPTNATASKDLGFNLSQAISSDAMESNADSLMDAVFADVDRMLERGVSLPVEASIEASVASTPEPVVPIESFLPPKLAPRDLIPQPVDSSVELAEPLAPAELSALESPAGLTEPTESKKGNNLLWFAVLCSSMLVSAAILSYLFRDRVAQVWVAVLGKAESTGITTTSTAEAPSEKDSDFLKYIQRSLDRLANQSDADSQKLATQPSPTISISPSAPTVIERVYVPVYPSPPASTPSTVPNVAQTPAPSTTSNPTTRTIPNVAENSSPAAPASVPNIAVTTHTLIGVLALGERSAALFDINGIPQRIEIGGQIGSSGWALVSINNQEAVVRKNGEVRSIYVGQKF